MPEIIDHMKTFEFYFVMSFPCKTKCKNQRASYDWNIILSIGLSVTIQYICAVLFCVAVYYAVQGGSNL